MFCEEILQDLRDLTRSIMTKKGVEHYDLNIEGLATNGGNYIGEVIFFNISSRKDGKNYRLVMKTAKRTEQAWIEVGDGILYSREMHMYSEVFPSLQEFGKEMDPTFELDIVPKAIWLSKEYKRETIIMENLISKGYKLWNKTKPMNLEHVLFVLRNYGKLHGLSMALKDKKPDVFSKLTKHMKDSTLGKMPHIGEIFGREFRNAVNSLAEAGKDELAKKFLEIQNDLTGNLLKKSKMEDKLAITHGDCWNTNMMFQYMNEGKSSPTSMCFLDFQLSMLDSPVRDLVYYIYVSCDKSALDQFELLLETYYDSLSSTIKKFGSDPNKLFTCEQLKEHWRKYAITGLIFSSLVIKLQLSSSDEVPNSADFGNDGKGFSNWFQYDIKEKKAYERRILDAFTHFSDTCL